MGWFERRSHYNMHASSQDMGTHAQLMQRSDVYRALVKRQIVSSDSGSGEEEEQQS